uniref:SFRICE_007984 n=1 Tax=Spodoptera frugiperda TaxID=7108 RepID=A0A2H1VBZ7_SPOFR
MKWVFYVIVFVYMLYRTVYGLKPVENSLMVEPVTYGDDDFLKVGGHKTISCKASNRNQKVEWIDPNGHTVKRIPGSRIFSQEHFVPAMRGRAPALVLTVTKAEVEDTGVYQCKSGDLVKNVTLCVIAPSYFADTIPEVSADMGRSITLSCQAKGDPEPRITWYRNGEVINDEDNSEKYKVMTKYNIQGFEGLLTIISLEPEDGGVYSCQSIQETADVEDCSHTTSFNITLNVNYAPIFEEGNKTKSVYGKNNQEVDIVCSADSYPAATYRWFKDLTDDVLYEFDKKQIKLSEDGSKAILTVVANQSTFWQRYKCQASNDFGVSEKYFTLMKMEKPKRPSEVNVFNATSDALYLNVTWYDDIQFPISAFQIQYTTEETNKKKFLPPREATWRRSKQTEVKLEEDETIDPEVGGIIIPLEELEAETAYWIRLRVTNEVGESIWSDPILVSTTVESEEATTTEAPESEPEVADNTESMNDATFYGIFFAGGIFVVSFVCMFAMRLVK